MSRRLVVLVAVLVTALLVVPAALALRVHVRVEGKTQTIYGSTEPTLTVNANALDALDSASVGRASSTTTSRPRRSARTSTRSAATWPAARRAGSSR